MNNFLVSANKWKHFTAWFWIIAAAFILSSIQAPATTPISGYSGLDALRELLTARWMSLAFSAVYIVAFAWMLWQIAMHLPAKQRWLRIALWTALAFVVAKWFCARWIASSQPVQGASAWQSTAYALNILNTLYVVCMLWAGWLLVRNNGGRLRHLGWAILAWVVVPQVFSLLLALLWQNTETMILLLWVPRCLYWVLTLYVFWRMRQVFIPNWAPDEGGKE